MALKSLDLFSGIGGISHALRGIAEPVLLCERDAAKKDVLTKRYPGVPVHDDITTLNETIIPAGIDLVQGGWPCFPAGTPVLTDKGYVPIETVTGTEMLLTHTGSWKPIENLQRKLFTGRMASVSVKRHFQPIRCTDNHPFYARTLTNAEPDWVPARNLTEKHYVGFPTDDTCVSGSFIENGYVWYEIEDVSSEQVDEPEWVYNFQVQDDHSYVVQGIVVKNCTGFSVSGKRLGFANRESALFEEFARVVRVVRPNLIFQENVPSVTNVISHICKTFDDMGYDSRWVCLPAHAVGAPQFRRRWYCLSVRRDTILPEIHIDPDYQRFSWSQEPVRMTHAPTPKLCAHLGMLGDAVVPDAVRAAFLYLISAPHAVLDVEKLFEIRGKVCVSVPVAAKRPSMSRDRKYGMCVRGVLYKYAISIPPPPEVHALTLDPTAFESDIEKPDRMDHVATHRLWATPRGQNRGASRTLTRRTQRDLYTQLRFEKDTPDDLRGGHPNIEWALWLMGFPPLFFGTNHI